MADLYEVLGVERAADVKAIRRAYRKKAKSAHPDAGGSQAEFEAIKRAHDVLTDPERRKKYDEAGDESDPAPNGPSSEAVMHVASALDEALGRITQRGRKVTETDVVAAIREVLQGRRSDPVQLRANIGRAILDNEAMLGRFSVKEGGNLLDGFIRQRIAALHAQAEQTTKAVAALDKAIEIVNRHTFRFDRTDRPFQAQSMYSDAVRAFIENSGASVIG